jgi:hypothetical protein
MFDPHVCRHGDAADVPTYIRGTKRLDYCLLDTPRHAHLSACGINLYNDLYHSDHRALFLDLRLRSFLNTTLPPIPPSAHRFMGTRSADVKHFVNIAYDHLVHNHAFTTFKTFSAEANTLNNLWVRANKIDDLIGPALSLAESKCHKRPRPP